MFVKKKINNAFFELIAIFISFVFGFFRGIFYIFKSPVRSRNIFNDFLDFTFSSWPRFFWSKPSFYKLFRFPGDLINNIFKK